MFSEAQAGKDICDRLIGPEKTCVKNHVKQENDVDTASQLCAALCTITTLTGHHSVVEYEPFQTASTPAIPVRKTAATKNFARWSEVWIDKTADGKFQKSRVREQFEIGNFTHLNAEDLVNLERLKAMELPTTLVALGEGTMGAGYTRRVVPAARKQSDPKPLPNVHTVHKLPFSCHQCCRVFYSQARYQGHMEANIHDPPLDTLADAIGKLLQKNLGEKITPMHTRLACTVLYDIQTAVPEHQVAKHFARGWGRKPKRRPTKKCHPETRSFLLELFRKGINANGRIDRSQKVSAKKAHRLLKIHATRHRWGPEKMLNAKQITGQFSRFSAIMKQKSWDLFQHFEFADDVLGEIDEVLLEDEDSEDDDNEHEG